MIVKMSKIQIAGPHELLRETLGFLRKTGTFQIEHDTVGFIDKKDEQYIDSFLPDKRTLTERLFLENLRQEIDELFTYLPGIMVRSSYIDPTTILGTIQETLKRHIPASRELHKKKEDLQKDLSELSRYTAFLDSVEPLTERIKDTPDIECIGLTLRDAGAEQVLREVLILHTDGNYELITSKSRDGTIAGLLAVHKSVSEKVKTVLNTKDIPELRFPPSFRDLAFIDKIHFLRETMRDMTGQIEGIESRLRGFTEKWGPIYRAVKEWIDERLSLIGATASAFETSMCFLIYGWMPSGDVGSLKKKLAPEFEGKVVIEELEIKEEDTGRMPVILRNPAYFQPFELFTRILPLPRYTSYDPTPFIGIFFPIFFGMILGDAGYGAVLVLLSLFMIHRFRRNRTVSDAFKILSVASLYCIIFGFLYGEFFGELGHLLFGLTPLLVERRTAIIPMLSFAVTVGVVHILIGSFLGFAAACKRNTKREAICRLFNILMILCVLVLVASLFGLFPSLLTRPIILGILFISPFLLFTGGLLAPLELIKSIGNIISYARIMAIGLTSVLLAYVANRMAGMTGDIITGVVVAGLLHLLNIVIGVFSPTIHSLRLHYVEFFSKFIETGGKKFEPLRKEK